MSVRIIREVAADVIKRGATRAVYAKQHDLNSRFLNVRIQEDGKDIKVDPALMVLLNVERPDNAENIFVGTVNDDGSVQVPLTQWMLELEGTLVCDISIVSTDPTVARLTTMQFNIYVEAAVVADEVITETEEYSLVLDMLDRVTEAERRTRELIYIGTGTPPDGAVIWIDSIEGPDGTSVTLCMRDENGLWVPVPMVLTDEDKSEIVAEVLDALPYYDGKVTVI